MLNFIIIKLVIFLKNICKQRSEPGNIPLPVSEVIDKITYSFLRCDLEEIIEATVSPDDPRSEFSTKRGSRTASITLSAYFRDF